MRVLIVEDDKNTVAVLVQELLKIPHVTTEVAESKEAALNALQATEFDFVINDLRIPTMNGALDADKVHGLAVHSYVREHSNGTPIVIFTGYETFELAQQLYESSARCDVWASKTEIPLTRLFSKTQLPECLAAVKAAADQLAAVESVEISMGAASLTLSQKQCRVLQLFGRFNSGANIIVSQLGGGLSNTTVFRVTVEDQKGAPASHAVAKIGPINLLADERERYETYVAPVMAPGCFAPVIRFCNAGAGNFGGIFYSLASVHEETLLDVLEARPQDGPKIVHRLRTIEGPWQSKTHLENKTVGDIRRLFISDGDFAAVAPNLSFDWLKLESKQIALPFCRQHFDLHGLNVLISNGAEPLVIDYGEVGVGPACVDPLILELSVLFHPSAERLRDSWPSEDQAKVWDDLSSFSKGCTFAEYVSECRKWSHDVASRDSAVYATAYSFAVRQLKYPKVRHDLALNIAAAACRRLTKA